MQLLTLHDLKKLATPEKPYVCFRSAVAGAPGHSMHNGAAYGGHKSRTWPNDAQTPKSGPDRDPARYIADHGRFVDYFLNSLGLPDRTTAQSLIDAGTPGTPVVYRGAVLSDGSGRGQVLVVDRKKKRALRNVGEVMAAAGVVGGGRPVQLVDWGAMSTRGQAAAALSSDLVLAIHGAGTVNSIFLRRGAAWIDLLPPRSLNFAPVFLATSQRLGVRWYTLPLVEQFVEGAPRLDAHNQPFFDADLPATTAVMSLALGREARR